MDENRESEGQPAAEPPVEDASTAVPADPEERAFSGHPDHPPATPDQPVEGNQELLRGAEQQQEGAGGDGGDDADGNAHADADRDD